MCSSVLRPLRRRRQESLSRSQERGLEGIVAKRRNSSYVQKRSRDWLKMKITRRQEAVIGGYTDPRGVASISVR